MGCIVGGLERNTLDGKRERKGWTRGDGKRRERGDKGRRDIIRWTGTGT